VARPELPSFDLVLATVGRVEELARFLGSLEAQTHRRFRVLLVDQNDDDRLDSVLSRYGALEIAHLRSEPGLSRARNQALGELRGELVAFPDDDCVYPPDLLERVADRFATQELAGLTGRSVDEKGRSSPSWKLDAARLTETNLWNRAISYTIFLRRDLIEEVGAFDERLGLGSGTPWSSAEEIDYLVRALRLGARIEYAPGLTVSHSVRKLTQVEGFRDGASLGYILRKHRYQAPEVLRRLVRPLGGMLLSLARLDRPRLSFHAATLRGRVFGWRRAPRG
jgi:GT2 family glycosyltransferase